MDVRERNNEGADFGARRLSALYKSKKIEVLRTPRAKQCVSCSLSRCSRAPMV